MSSHNQEELMKDRRHQRNDHQSNCEIAHSCLSNSRGDARFNWHHLVLIRGLLNARAHRW
jgi:hypothetical protein